jgi:hypothetical protein
LYFDITDLLIPQGTVIPWTHPLLHFLLVIVLMQLSMQFHRYRVSFQNPARSRNYPGPGKALE